MTAERTKPAQSAASLLMEVGTRHWLVSFLTLSREGDTLKIQNLPATGIMKAGDFFDVGVAQSGLLGEARPVVNSIARFFKNFFGVVEFRAFCEG